MLFKLFYENFDLPIVAASFHRDVLTPPRIYRGKPQFFLALQTSYSTWDNRDFCLLLSGLNLSICCVLTLDIRNVLGYHVDSVSTHITFERYFRL